MNIIIPTNTSATLLLTEPMKTPKNRRKLSSNKTTYGSPPLDGSMLQVVTVTASTIMSQFKATVGDESLSLEDREAREKGLQLAARIEHLCQSDEGFRRWIQEGLDDIEAGHTVIFSEDGWKEE